MGTPGWRPGLSQNAPSLATSTRAVASSAGWAQTSGEGGAHSHPCSRGCACGRGIQPGTLGRQGSNCPAHTSRLCSRSLPEVCTAGPTTGLGHACAPAAPGPSSPARWLTEAHAGHAGAHLHQPPGPPKSKVLGNVLPAPQPPPPRRAWTQALAAPTLAHGALGPRGRGPPKGEQVTEAWHRRPAAVALVGAPGHGAAAGRAVPARGTEEPLCLADGTARPVCLPPAASEDPALCPQSGTCLARRRLAPSERPRPCAGSVNAGPHDRSRRSRVIAKGQEGVRCSRQSRPSARSASCHCPRPRPP